MVDESRDISGNEQLSVVVRVIDVDIKGNNDQNYQSSLFKEYFLGFTRLVEFDAQSLTNEIVKFLSSLNICMSIIDKVKPLRVKYLVKYCKYYLVKY